MRRMIFKVLLFTLVGFCGASQLVQGDQFNSPAHHYSVKQIIGLGDNGLVGEASMSPLGSVLESDGPIVALKCSIPQTEEDYDSQFRLMEKFSSQTWCPVVHEIFITPNGMACISMERLGMDLRTLRGIRSDPWHPVTIASITLVMLDVLESLHRLGYTHSDAHAANWLLVRDDPKKLKLVDYGFVVRLDGHPSKSADHLVLNDLRQIALSARFFITREERYYQAKKITFDPNAVCADMDEYLCSAILFVYSFENTSPTIYSEIREQYRSVISVHGVSESYIGILWEPTVISFEIMNNASADQGPIHSSATRDKLSEGGTLPVGADRNSSTKLVTTGAFLLGLVCLLN